MKRLSIFFAALMACTLSFAVNYEQVTDASILKAGDVVVIGSADKGKVAAAIGTGKFLTAVDATFTKGIVALDNAYEITLSGESSAWTLTSAEGVLGSTAAKTMAIGKGTTTWTIAIDKSGKATITCGTNGKILYNVGSPRFLNYTSDPTTSMILPELYKKAAGGETPVTPVAVESVALDQTELSLEAGKTTTLVATITPANATNKEVTWKSDAETIATVADGVVTAVAEGKANITVTTTDGAKTATCAITVTAAAINPEPVVTFDATKDKAGDPATTLTKDGITLTIKSGTLGNGTDYRIYKSSTLTITSTVGKINSVEFTCTAEGTAKYGPGCFEGTGYEAGKGKTGTWTGNAEEFTLTATSNQVRATKIVVNYAPLDPDAIAKPTFTTEESDFMGSITVALGIDAENLDIYYTLDGTEPTTASTKYTEPFILTETTTVKAVAYDATANKYSEIVEKTYTAYTMMTCADANAAKDGDVIFLNEVTVVYANDANIYVADATGITLVYSFDLKDKLQAGQVIKGIKGSMKIFNGLPEIEPSVAFKDLTITEGGTIPAPTVLAAVPTTDDVNKYIAIKGVKFDKDYKAYTSKTNATALVGETELVVRNNFTIDFGDLMKAYTYDITGFVSIYKETIQFYPIAINDITMHGNYTIGTAEGCNYKSLAAAFTAYNTNAAAGIVLGDVTFQVATDLDEPKNVGIQNPTDFTVTLTVDKAEHRTISFSQAGDNAGPSGNICIGCDMTLTHTCASVETKNVVFDGSFNGSDDNYLTIKSVAGCHKLNGPVLIYGNVKNTTIKNCNLIAENGVGSSLYPVTIRSQKGTDFAPENIVIDGNYIEANKGTADQGIYFQLTTAGKVKPANVTISNNEIVATTRGIFMKGINGANIFDNTIKVKQTNAGMLSYGIWGMQDTEGEFNIDGNIIAELGTGAAASGSGIYGIVANAGKWYIRNNYVSGFNVLATAADNIALVGIQGSSNADTVVIEHNTVAMAEQTNKVANASAAKICLIKAVSAKASVKNNLVVSNETGFANALVSPAGIVESNVYCTKSYVGSADSIKTLVDYKTIHEATAKSVESVVFENLAQGILDLVDASNGDANLGVARLADVAIDIYGKERGEFTYAGAYEGSAIQPGPGTDVEDINVNSADVKKIVRDGQVLIIRDGKTYNMMGQIVE